MTAFPVLVQETKELVCRQIYLPDRHSAEMFLSGLEIKVCQKQRQIPLESLGLIRGRTIFQKKASFGNYLKDNCMLYHVFSAFCNSCSLKGLFTLTLDQCPFVTIVRYHHSKHPKLYQWYPIRPKIPVLVPLYNNPYAAGG